MKATKRFFIPPWLDDLKLRPIPFRVFCNLLRRAGEDGKCYPSAQSIASDCRINRDTVWPTIKILIDEGLVTKLPKGFRQSNCYVINFPTSGNEGPIAAASIGGNEGPIESPQPAETRGLQSAEKDGCQPAEMRGLKEIHSKEIHLKKSNRELFSADEILPFDSEEFREAWNEWQQHRREIKKKLTPTSIRQQLRELRDMGEAKAIDAIRFTIAKGWQGIRQNPDFQPADGRPQSYDEVRDYALACNVSESLAGLFYDESAASGWRDFTGPFQSWRSAFNAFVQRRELKATPALAAPAKKPIQFID